MKPTTEAKSHDTTLLVEYNSAIDALDKTIFMPDIICLLHHGFKGKSVGITSLTLYRYFLDLRRLMRSQILLRLVYGQNTGKQNLLGFQQGPSMFSCSLFQWLFHLLFMGAVVVG
jgi:hypothetical protein